MIITNTREVHRLGHGQPALRQPAFDLKIPDKYAELISFKMEVINILQTRTYEINDEEKVPIIKELARKGGTSVNTNIHTFQKKRHAKQQKDCL